MENVEKILDAFLDSLSPGVIAIKGDWGAGKTYFVSHYLQQSEKLANKLVSFVSLFGLSDTEQIRCRILPSAISAKKLKEGKKISWLRKSLEVVRLLPKFSDYEALFRAVDEYQTRNLVIVFDDIERKSNSLSLKDFLGLVNFLAEHAACKIIIILNEDQIFGEDKKELGIFREKLIDREVLFAPTYKDNAKLFFKDHRLFEYALDIFTRAECRNLRVINKCYLAVEEFRRELSSLNTEQQERVLERVILLSCLFYQYGGQIDFSDLQGSYLKKLYRNITNLKEEETEGSKILKKVGYIVSDCDNIICEYLASGLFDVKTMASFIEAQKTRAEQIDFDQQQREIYKLVWANFQGAADDFSKQLSGFLDRNLDQLGWNNILEATNTLKQVGFQGNIHKWTDAFLISHASKLSFGECKSFAPIANLPEAKQAISERLKFILTKRHPKEVIYSMVENSGWNPEDVATLDQYSIAEYVTWLRDDKSDDLLQTLKQFIKMFNPQQPDPQHKSIGEKIFAAFRVLCKANDFNRYKLINNLGISPELLDEPNNG